MVESKSAGQVVIHYCESVMMANEVAERLQGLTQPAKTQRPVTTIGRACGFPSSPPDQLIGQEGDWCIDLRIRSYKEWGVGSFYPPLEKKSKRREESCLMTQDLAIEGVQGIQSVGEISSG